MSYRNVSQIVERRGVLAKISQYSKVRKSLMNSKVKTVKAKKVREAYQGIINQASRVVANSLKLAKTKKMAPVRSQKSVNKR